MGCNQSKKTTKTFNEQLAKLETQLKKLSSVKNSFQKVILPVYQDLQDCPKFKRKTELTHRLDKLQDMIREIQNFHVTTRYSYTNQIIVQQNESFSPSEDECLQSSRANLAMIEPIIDDPSIKAIIELKRKKLENKNKRHPESSRY